MPTPEANTSSPLPSSPPSSSLSLVALRNANITELATEEADSFKANVSIMTQDQCLDNGHQAISNERSLADKVSDDLNNSINSVVSNGVNSVQDLNVDVGRDREYTTDLVIAVQNHTVDTDSSSTGKVSPPPQPPTPSTSSKHSTETPSEFVVSNSRDNLENNSINNIDANKSEYSNSNIGADMTVIKHQNSGENIRDIIANSEKANANKNSSDSQLVDRVDKIVVNNRDVVNSRSSANKSTGSRRSRKLIRSDNVNESDIDDQVESPIERLNKLRASISSALSEVKGVLKQYSTEQSIDEPNESAPSYKQAPDNGPVRFRFVRKVRRRSVFSEEDETEIPPATISDVKALPIIETQVVEELPKDNQKDLSNENKDLAEEIKNEKNQVEESIKKDNGESNKKQQPIQTATDVQIAHQEKSDNADVSVVGETQKTLNRQEPSKADGEAAPPSTTSETSKVKIVKIKKILKKDRRASIAAVEINQMPNDQSAIAPVELKTQRRPSDSATLVKQTTRVKTIRTTSDKPKLPSSRKTKTVSSSKTDISVTKPTDVEKIETVSSPIENKPTSSAIVDDSTKILETNTSSGPTAAEPVISLKSTQETSSESPVIVDSKTLEATKDITMINKLPDIPDLSSDLPIIAPAVTTTPVLKSTVNTEVPPTSPIITEAVTAAEDNAVKLVTAETTPADLLQTSKNETDAHKPVEISPVTLQAPETVTTPIQNSTLNADLLQTIPVDVKLNTSAVTVAPIPADTTKAIPDLSDSKPETLAVTAVKPTKIEQPSNSQQNLKTTTGDANIDTPNQQTSKSKPSTHGIKSGIPIKKPNTTAPVAKLPVASPAAATVKSVINPTKVLPTKNVSSLPVQSKLPTKKSTEAASAKAPKTVQTAEKKKSSESVVVADSKIVKHEPINSSAETSKKTSDETSGVEAEEPLPSNVPKDAIAVKFNLTGQESVDELQRLEGQQDKETSPSEATPTTEAPAKKKKKAKRKVVIRRIKRKLSKDDTFLSTQEAAAELEVVEKEIEEKDDEEEPEEEIPDVPKKPKSCLKLRQYEIGDVVMYAEHYKKTQVRWKKAIVTERITSISYKLNINGDERPAHISYIKKFTDRKVNFGGKEYLEIDYAQIEENEEKERNYSIWNHV